MGYYIATLILGIFVLVISSAVPSVFATHNSHLFVSAENSQYANYFGGPMVIEVVVSDPDISSTTQGRGEPDVTVNGNKLRMIQATDGNWYGYFASRTQAQYADETVRASGAPGYGLDFGVFCNGGSYTAGAIGVSFNEAHAIALPRSNGLGGYADGTNLITDCTGSPDAGTKLNKVLREAPTLNTNPNLPVGQLGIDVDAWPLIQLYDFPQSGNAVIQYYRGGVVEKTTLVFDTIPSSLSAVSLFQSAYRPGNQVKFSLTDLQLNIDPTDEDSWTFATSYNSAQTRYRLFDENGNADAACALGNPACSGSSDYGSGSPDIVPSMFDLMFEDNGVLRINTASQGPQVIDFRDNGDQILDVLIGNIQQPVTVVETAKNSGAFVNYDESDLANVYVLQNAPYGPYATIDYNDSAHSVVLMIVPQEFVAIRDGDWSDPETWGTIYAPITLEFIDTVTIPAGITVTIPSEVTVTNSGLIQNRGTLINQGTINNSGTITSYPLGEFNNNNLITNTGTINSPCGATYSGNPPTVNLIQYQCTLSIGDVTLHEGSDAEENYIPFTQFNFPVTLTITSGQNPTVPISVDFTPRDGVAIVNDDYLETSGTLVFLPGEFQKIIEILVFADNDVEGDESFFIDLSNPTGTVISDPQGLGTILNDDILPVDLFCGQPESYYSKVVRGTAGNDDLKGTAGNDLIIGNAGNDKINGKDGNDCLIGGDGNDKIQGGKGADTIEGNTGNDKLMGQDGNDAISGGDGNDKMWGGKGIDTIDAGAGNDEVHANQDNDNVSGGLGDDWLGGGKGNDVISGNAGNDKIYGRQGNDTLNGNEGNDKIQGGEGNDSIDGGANTDTCNGGSGTNPMVNCEVTRKAVDDSEEVSRDEDEGESD